MHLRTADGAQHVIGPVAACAWPDVCGAGLRALASLEPADGCSSSTQELVADGVGDSVSPQIAARLVNFSDANGVVRSSLLLFHLAVSEAQHTEAAAALHSFLLSGSQKAATIVPVAAMRFPASVRDDSVMVRAIAFHGGQSNKRPGFPEDTPLQDGILAGLLHLCRAAGTPTLALLAQGFPRQSEEDACEVARALAAAACGTLDCGFAAGAAAKWAPREPSVSEGDDAMLYV